MKKNRVLMFLMALVVALTLSFSVCAESADTAAQPETAVQETAPAEVAAESGGSSFLVIVVVFAIALGIALLIFYNTKKDK